MDPEDRTKLRLTLALPDLSKVPAQRSIYAQAELRSYRDALFPTMPIQFSPGRFTQLGRLQSGLNLESRANCF